MASGKLRGIAITTPTRTKMLPDLPAVAETLPGYRVMGWYGYFAPAATPRELVRRINADAVAIIKRPDYQARAAKDNLEPVGSTPEELAALLKADLDMWTRVVKETGVKAEL
jgi:tripartite-type tricarboxylate transporter receptor subunit TctC